MTNYAEILREILAELDTLPLDAQVEAINAMKLELHAVSPFKSEPVDCVLWVRNTTVTANDYNPNTVAPPEMELLKHSIGEDGYTQPIVTWDQVTQREVIDGFHRHRVGKEDPTIQARVHGYLPVVTINAGRQELGDRMASTIRHNRARGKHRIEAMSDIVIELPCNGIYEKMHKAGVPISQQRLCQPYGDDQRKGLWLYHILEPQTWFKLIARVNGAKTGALYIQETGNVTGYNKITKPDGHTWKSFCNLLLQSLPKKTREHYIARFRSFIRGWQGRGYTEGIPDEAPKVLEDAQWAPSYRRMCKVLLRNDHWCKGLGLTQPKSAAYGKYLEIKKARNAA